MNSVTLSFKNTEFDIVDLNGQKWLRGLQIASALGYSDAGKSISKLYERNADEFTPSMTALVKLPDLHHQIGGAGSELDFQTGSADPDLPPQNAEAGQRREVRIFSLRGAHLLGMLANTEPAKDFRRWILDVLENANQSPTLTATLQYRLLAANPKLGLTLLYRQHQLSINEIAALLRITPRKVGQFVDDLVTCGLIPSTSPETQLALI